MGETGLQKTNSNETKHVDALMLRPIASPDQLIERHKEVTAIIKDALELGKDYGPIPGTQGKNVLLKPGAERLCVAFGCQPTYKAVASDVDHDRMNAYFKYGKPEKSVGFYRYVISCELIRNGIVVGSGLGSCSTMEGKYISRPRDVENTVLKMAQKRAMVAAVLNTFALSDRFTQDMEKEDDEDVDADKVQAVVAEVVEDKKRILYHGTEEEQKGLAIWLAENHQDIPDSKYFEIHDKYKGKPKKDILKIIKEVMG